MADYFCQFSVTLPLGDATLIGPALAIYRKLEEDLERDEEASIGFDAVAASEEDAAALWLSAEQYGDPEHVIAFVQLCAEAFDLSGRWGFRWALTCSRLRLDGFGGGAHVLDLATGETVEWLDCDHWLTMRLDEAVKPAAAAAPVSRISASGAASAERLLREAAENRRRQMADEPSLAREIDNDAAELNEVADALGTLLRNEGAIALQG